MKKQRCLTHFVVAITALLVAWVLATPFAQDILVEYTRPLWGTPDAPVFMQEIVMFGFQAATAGKLTAHGVDVATACKMHGWRARNDSDVAAEAWMRAKKAGASDTAAQGTAEMARQPRRVFDVFLFSTELSLLELRLEELDGVVDTVVLVESTRTHTNRSKPLWWTDLGRHQGRFSRFLNRIESVVVTDEDIDSYLEERKETLHSKEDMAFSIEALMRRRGFEALLHNPSIEMHARDAFIIGDMDEIPRRDVALLAKHCEGLPFAMTLQMPTYHGGFMYRSYEPPKTNAGIRIYNPRLLGVNWAGHHNAVGTTVCYSSLSFCA